MGTLNDRKEHFVSPGADLSQYVLLALLLAGISFKSPGAILYVDATATGTNNGSSWPNAFTNLASALNASLDGDELWIAAGVYQPGTGEDIQASFQVTKPISLYGGFHGNETSLQQRNWITNATILSGDLGVPEERSDNSVHVVVIQSEVPARLDGLTIRDGGNPFEGEGAGILDIGFSSPPDRADLGHILANCTFTQNHALTAGGAISTHVNASMLITNCTFAANSAAFSGGALAFNGPHLAIKNSRFIANQSLASGGAVNVASPTTVLFENCIFERNEASENGGALNARPQNITHPLTVNCLFFQNQAGANGGAMHLPNASIVNCTIVQNTAASGSGGGIAGSSIDVVNSILWTNAAAIEPQVNLGTNSVSITFSNVEGGFPGDGNISADPRFASPQTGDFRLSADSPVIDRGNTLAVSGLVATDLKGDPRVVRASPSNEDRVDMGAYEFVNVIRFTSIHLSLENQILLRFAAPPGTYEIEATEALGSWASLGTAVAGNGYYQFIDPAPSSPRKFYRVRAR